ncbi:IS5 family transposase [Streptomyces sp. NPDC056049]|uniref:IS5 family transposase n=1 Tax=Streptomyces sp. NPDC056049 TaxID=3345693 RepID=UPI0035DABE1C
MRTGATWTDVPTETIGCIGVTCWRRLRDWTEAAVWPRLDAILLTELRKAGLLDMDDAAIDGSPVRALKGGSHRTFAGRPRRSGQQAPPDHRPPRHTPRHLADQRKRHDVTQLRPLLDTIPHIRGRVGRPRHRPRRLFADRGHAYDKYRRLLRTRGITPKIARRGTAHGSGLGKTRWVIERTFAWLHQFKRLRIRYERRADLHLGLHQLACSIICLRRLRTSL